MKTKNKYVTLIAASILLLIIAIAGATYAFFTATITDGDKGSSVIIQTGTLRLVYSDTEYINVSGILPGDSYSKTVTVTNEGNVPVYYHLVWIELLNELVTKADLTMSITCTSSTDTCDGLIETTVADSGSNIPILYNVEIGALEVHTYVITLLFKETGSNQNDNQGKDITGKIGIIEARDLSVNLYGYVYDENSQAMPNVIVELHSDPVSALTDENGRYEFDTIPLGTHTAYIKTNDKTSTITTTALSLTQGKKTSIQDTNVTIPASRQSIGININAESTDTNLSLTLPTGILKGTGGADGYSYIGEYYAYKSSITSIIFDNVVNIPADAISSWNVANDGSSKVVAYIKSDGVSGYDLHIQGKDGVYAPLNSSYLFYNFTQVTRIENMQYLDSSITTNMKSMFSMMRNLSEIDLSSFTTANVTNMSDLFSYCHSLTYLNLENFDTSSVTDMSRMFYVCYNILSLDVSNFDTSNVTDMSAMFAGEYFDGSYRYMKFTSLNLENFDTSKVTSMRNMFAKCSHLTNLNITSFITSNVLDMAGLFSKCSSLAAMPQNSFNTSKVTDMSYMFEECSNMTSLNLSNFDTSNVTNMNSMFYWLPLIVDLDLSNFYTPKLREVNHMFQNESSLKHLYINNMDFSIVYSYSTAWMFNSLSNGITVHVKDANAQTFINKIFNDYTVTGTVTIG